MQPDDSLARYAGRGVDRLAPPWGTGGDVPTRGHTLSAYGLFPTFSVAPPRCQPRLLNRESGKEMKDMATNNQSKSAQQSTTTDLSANQFLNLDPQKFPTIVNMSCEVTEEQYLAYDAIVNSFDFGVYVDVPSTNSMAISKYHILGLINLHDIAGVPVRELGAVTFYELCVRTYEEGRPKELTAGKEKRVGWTNIGLFLHHRGIWYFLGMVNNSATNPATPYVQVKYFSQAIPNHNLATPEDCHLVGWKDGVLTFDDFYLAMFGAIVRRTLSGAMPSGNHISHSLSKPTADALKFFQTVISESAEDGEDKDYVLTLINAYLKEPAKLMRPGMYENAPLTRPTSTAGIASQPTKQVQNSAEAVKRIRNTAGRGF